jgi:hypothetical protein
MQHISSIIFHDTLSKEQLQRMRELELILPPIIDCGFEFSINFDAYEALELSSDQRDKLHKIQLQHSQLQDQIALSNTDMIKFPFIYHDTLENPLSDNKNTYTQNKLAQKKEIQKKVIKFKVEYQDAINKILTQQQKDKLDKLRKEVPPKLATLHIEALKEIAE